MRLCPNCRADSPKLVHFGIYLCPTCGTIDADGQKVTPPPGVLLTPAASPAIYESLVGAAPTPVADDTQPNPIAAPPPMPLGAPMPMPLGAPPPMPLGAPMPLPMSAAPPHPAAISGPRPLPLAVAPPHPASLDPLTVVPPPQDGSRTSFAAPPPRDPRDLVTASTGPPRILMTSLAVFTGLNLFGLVAGSESRTGAHVLRVGMQIFFAFSLLSGRAWARNWSLVSNGLALVFVLILMMLPLPAVVRVALGIGASVTAWWIYVLFRPDVVAYCNK